MMSAQEPEGELHTVVTLPPIIIMTPNDRGSLLSIADKDSVHTILDPIHTCTTWKMILEMILSQKDGHQHNCVFLIRVYSLSGSRDTD